MYIHAHTFIHLSLCVSDLGSLILPLSRKPSPLRNAELVRDPPAEAGDGVVPPDTESAPMLITHTHTHTRMNVLLYLYACRRM